MCCQNAEPELFITINYSREGLKDQEMIVYHLRSRYLLLMLLLLQDPHLVNGVLEGLG